MRVLRASLTLATAALGLAPELASAQQAKPYDFLTRNAPVFRGVDYDLPAPLVKGTDPAIKAAVEACKLEVTAEGYTVKDGQGKIVRRFLDVNPAKTKRAGEADAGRHLDQWSYYQDGFEVYREVDRDEDGSLDEVRWMNSGGTRIAQVKPVEGGGVRVVAWTRISAEEASKVLVQALVGGDNALLESVLATPEELTAIGAPKSTLDRATEARADRAKGLAAILATLKATGWTGATTWSRFDGTMPRVIPVDATPGLKNEVILYENVAIFADAGNPAANLKLAYLSVPEVVKIGDAWKFVDLPHAVDPAKPTGGALVSLRSDIFQVGGTGEPVTTESLKELAAHDAKPLPADAGKRDVADWHVSRVKILQKVVAESTAPETKLIYQKQAVNDLAEATRTDLYPEGLAVLDKFVQAGGKIASAAAYRKILVEFDLALEQPGADMMKEQKDSLEKFAAFVSAFPKSDEEPEALLQLATMNDFNSDEAEAKKWYARLVKDYPAAEAGKKAEGAIRRLDSDGKVMKLAGPGLDGKPVSLVQYAGKPVVVVYWTAADAKELSELGALRDKLGAKGFEIVGVNLDYDKATADAAAKDGPSNMVTIFEPGGMDGRLANEMGIISTPTMILLDAKGLVANRKIRRAAEVEKALEKNLAGRGVGLR